MSVPDSLTVREAPSAAVLSLDMQNVCVSLAVIPGANCWLIVQSCVSLMVSRSYLTRELSDCGSVSHRLGAF